MVVRACVLAPLCHSSSRAAEAQSTDTPDKRLRVQRAAVKSEEAGKTRRNNDDSAPNGVLGYLRVEENPRHIREREREKEEMNLNSATVLLISVYCCRVSNTP